MPSTRRHLLETGALVAAGLLLRPTAAAAAASPPAVALTPDRVPPLPDPVPPGRPGEFDFLTGEWRIRNRSLVDGAWLEYDGEASVYGILAGVGSVEELRIPARGFSGLGLRLLDVERRVWVDHWVNAKQGVLTLPGQTGGFVDGAGVFSSTWEDGGRSMLAAGIWDRITPVSCRWRQVVSADGGRTWEHNWIMHWSRA